MRKTFDMLVIDASVAVKLFIPEELADRAVSVFTLLEESRPPILFVPDLFFIECANVFRSRVRIHAMSPGDATDALSLLMEFPFERHAAHDLSAPALDLALQYDLSAYDGCYLALAARIGAPLITADKKFVRKLSGSDHQVIWLGEWEA